MWLQPATTDALPAFLPTLADVAVGVPDVVLMLICGVLQEGRQGLLAVLLGHHGFLESTRTERDRWQCGRGGQESSVGRESQEWGLFF